MSISNLFRDLSRWFKSKDWCHSYAGSCPVYVCAAVVETNLDSVSRSETVASGVKRYRVSSVGAGLERFEDDVITHTGVNTDEIIAVNQTSSRKLIHEALTAEKSRCIVGYDVECITFEGAVEGDEGERQNRDALVAHQFYFAYNGRRKAAVILTDIRFTEQTLIDFIAEIVPAKEELQKVYLAAHFSLVEGGWLTEKRTITDKFNHLQCDCDDPELAATIDHEMGLLHEIIGAIYIEAGLPLTKHGKKYDSSVSPVDISFLDRQVKKRFLKYKDVSLAFNAFSRGEIKGLLLSEQTMERLSELRSFRPIIPKRDKMWHGTYRCIKDSELDKMKSFRDASKEHYLEDLASRYGDDAFFMMIHGSVVARNTGKNNLAGRFWRACAYRDDDHKRYKRSKNAKALVPRLPKRQIVFCDTTNFGLGSLSNVGDAIGIKKLKLHDGNNCENKYAIEDMREHLRMHALDFLKYSARDAIVTGEALAFFSRMFRMELQLPLSTRMAGYSALHFTDVFKHDVYGLPPGTPATYLKQYLGWEEKKHTNGKKSWFPSPEMETFARFYYGGWNACHVTGSRGPCTYHDLKSAYPCAVLMLQHDYDFSQAKVYRGTAAGKQVELMKNAGAFQIAGLEISFEFKAGVEPIFPCRMDKTLLPPMSVVEASELLVFPRSGYSNVMWPEFWAAENLDLLKWYKVHTLVTYEQLHGHAFADEVKELLIRRGQKGKKLIYKNILNYIYGKTAEGIKKQPVNTAHGTGDRRSRPGSLTCFPIAAYSTSVCRAVVGELLQKNTCYAITTDGFISPVEELNYDIKKTQLSSTIAKQTTDRLRTITDYKGVPYEYIEKEFIAEESLFLKTRGYILTRNEPNVDGKRVKMAKMGVQTHKFTDPEDAYDVDVTEFIQALNAGEFVKKSWPGFARLKHEDKNLIPKRRVGKQRVSHTFDMKRVPDASTKSIKMSTFQYGGEVFEHPTFVTQPIETVNDFIMLRARMTRNMTLQEYKEFLQKYEDGGYCG